MDERRTGQAPKLSLGTPFRRSTQTPSADVSKEGAVRATDSDALLSRVSAVKLGYVPPDAYAPLFVSTREPPPRRPLLINIGTALRSGEVDERVDAFLSSGSLQLPRRSTNVDRVQIVSLGAGSDSRFWRLHEAGVGGYGLHQTTGFAHLHRYVEVDYPQIASHKSARIRAESSLHTPLGPLQESGLDEIHAEKYVLLADDLYAYGDQAQEEPLARLLAQLDTTLPTLFLWECVLAYLDPTMANRLMERIFAQVPNTSILCYDMCVGGDHAELHAPPDRFGRVMLQNLSARRLELVGARKYTTPESYAKRFQALLEQTRPDSQVHSGAYSLRSAWQTLDANDRQRLSRLEGLDEMEVLEMLLGHYCMSWAERHSS